MPKTRSKDDLHEDLSASSKNYVCHPNQPSKSHLIPPPTPSNHSTDPPQVRIRCLQPHQPRSGLAATPPVVKTHRLQPHTTPGQDSSSPTTPPQARTRHLQPYQPRSGLIVSNALNRAENVNCKKAKYGKTCQSLMFFEAQITKVSRAQTTHACGLSNVFLVLLTCSTVKLTKMQTFRFGRILLY